MRNVRLGNAFCMASMIWAMFSLCGPSYAQNCIKSKNEYAGRPTQPMSYGSYSAQQKTFYNGCGRSLQIAVCYKTIDLDYDCALASAAPNAAIISPTVVNGAKLYTYYCDRDNIVCINKLAQLARCKRRPEPCILEVKESWETASPDPPARSSWRCFPDYVSCTRACKSATGDDTGWCPGICSENGTGTRPKPREYGAQRCFQPR